LVTGRVKDYDECIRKFKRKYLPNIGAENTSYKIVDYLSDLIGIRTVCFYLEDVNVIRKKLKKHFHEIDVTNKTVLLEKTEDKFGYRSLHLDLTLKKKGAKSSEESKYYKIHFELQIRTVIQDAWSVLDHKIKYKKSIPHSLKRRINRLSALFEIADDEFLHIKEEISLEEKRINQRIKKGDVLEKNKPLDVFSFLFIAIKYFPDYKFIEFKVDGFVQEILNSKMNLTENELNEAIFKYIGRTDEIAKQERRGLNPYTIIRYCLYLFKQDIFDNLNFP
jgi:ppGpp synthetase/RelA/SpoT-type nucleotidyltranferase